MISKVSLKIKSDIWANNSAWAAGGSSSKVGVNFEAYFNPEHSQTVPYQSNSSIELSVFTDAMWFIIYLAFLLLNIRTCTSMSLIVYPAYFMSLVCFWFYWVNILRLYFIFTSFWLILDWDTVQNGWRRNQCNNTGWSKWSI